MLVPTLFLAILVGLSLGLLGGGGSILTVPILGYVAGMPPAAAIAASLFVVAVTSVVGIIPHARAGRVLWRTGLVFGAAGMAGAFAGGQLSRLFPPRLLMIAFGAMMVVTGIAMLRRRPATPRSLAPSHARALAQGFGVGVVTGLLGVGGGFLIVPALVLFGSIAMERAVGTSLLVIAMSAFAGFASHATVAIDWTTTLAVALVASASCWFGGRFVGRVPAPTLRRVFGVLVVAVAAFVLFQELGHVTH